MCQHCLNMAAKFSRWEKICNFFPTGCNYSFQMTLRCISKGHIQSNVHEFWVVHCLTSRGTLVKLTTRHNSGSNATPTPEKATNFNVTSDRSDLNEETVALVIFSVIYIVMEQQKKKSTDILNGQTCAFKSLERVKLNSPGKHFRCILQFQNSIEVNIQ